MPTVLTTSSNRGLGLGLAWDEVRRVRNLRTCERVAPLAEAQPETGNVVQLSARREDEDIPRLASPPYQRQEFHPSLESLAIEAFCQFYYAIWNGVTPDAVVAYWNAHRGDNPGSCRG